MTAPLHGSRVTTAGALYGATDSDAPRRNLSTATADMAAVGTLNFESLNRATSRASVGSAAFGAKDPDDAPRPPREKLTVSAEESVYSAILFLPSISRLKWGKEYS